MLITAVSTMSVRGVNIILTMSYFVLMFESMKLFVFFPFPFLSFVFNVEDLYVTGKCFFYTVVLFSDFSCYLGQAPVLFQGIGHSLNPTNSLVIFLYRSSHFVIGLIVFISFCWFGYTFFFCMLQSRC